MTENEKTLREVIKRWRDGYCFNEDDDEDVALNDKIETSFAALFTSKEDGREAGIRAAALIAKYGIWRASTDWNDGKKAQGAGEMATEIAEAILALLEPRHD